MQAVAGMTETSDATAGSNNRVTIQLQAGGGDESLHEDSNQYDAVFTHYSTQKKFALHNGHMDSNSTGFLYTGLLVFCVNMQFV